jgi:hypothetical protein
LTERKLVFFIQILFYYVFYRRFEEYNFIIEIYVENVTCLERFTWNKIQYNL